MRRLMIALLCTVALQLSVTAGQDFRPTVLSNGLQVIALENPTLPVITVQMTVRHGYLWARSPAEEGIAHFYEHMLFKGNSLTGSQEEFISRLNRMGVASWNGGTSSEFVTYYLTVPRSQLENCLQLWSAVLIDTKFDGAEVVKEQRVVRNEILGNRQRPASAYWRSVNRALYGSQQLFRTSHYLVEPLTNFTPKLLREIKQLFYRPNNTLIAIGGDIKKDKALELVKKYFSRWKRGDLPRLDIKTAPLQSTNLLLGGYPNPEAANLALYYRAPSLSDNPQLSRVAEVTAALLNLESGPVMRWINERAPVLSAKSSRFNFWGGRVFSELTFQTDLAAAPLPARLLNKQKRTVRAWQDALLNIVYTPGFIGENHLTAAKTSCLADRAYKSEKQTTLLQQVSIYWCLAGKDYYPDFLTGIEKVTLHDVKQFVLNYLLHSPKVQALWLHDRIYSIMEKNKK